MAEPLVDWTIRLDASQAAKAADDVRDKAKGAASAIVDLGDKTEALGQQSQKSLEAAGRAWDEQDIGESVKSMASARDKLRESLQRMVSDRREAATTLRNMGLGFFGAGALAVRGMSSAGTAESMQGQNLQAHQQQLNRQIASIFAPLTNEQTKYTAQLTNWLRGLTEPQKESLRTMAVFSTSMTVLGFVVPRATRAMATLAVSATAAARAEQLKTGVGAASGIAGMAGNAAGAMSLAGPIGMAVATGLALLSATPKGRESLAKLATAAEPIIEGLASAITTVADGLASAVKSATDFMDAVKRFIPGSGGTNSRGQAIPPADRRWLNDYLPMLGDLVNLWSGRTKFESRQASASSSTFSPAAGGLTDVNTFNREFDESGFRVNLQQTQVDLLREIRDAVRARVNTPEVQNKFAGNPFIGPPVAF